MTFNNPAQSEDWTPATAPILGPGSPLRPKEQVEGPTLVRFGNEWLLYADAFTAGHYSSHRVTGFDNLDRRNRGTRFPGRASAAWDVFRCGSRPGRLAET